MTGIESVQRAAVVKEAREWIGTPYHHAAMLKGIGADCATLIFAVYRGLGIVPDEKIGMFGPDWYQHTESEHYMTRLIRHAAKVVEAVGYRSTKYAAGNILLMKAGSSRVWNHGAIVAEWPFCIHAISPAVAEFDIGNDPMWSNQLIAVFDPWGKRE